MRWMVLLLVALPAAADPDCYCTDTGGGRVELGETICLTVDHRAYLARCEMSLNVPMWRDTGAACLSSALDLQAQRTLPVEAGAADAAR